MRWCKATQYYALSPARQRKGVQALFNYHKILQSDLTLSKLQSELTACGFGIQTWVFESHLKKQCASRELCPLRKLIGRVHIEQI